ncbi:MAG: hypothetical protein WD176_03420, partial [Pirellulales bacterium]
LDSLDSRGEVRFACQVVEDFLVADRLRRRATEWMGAGLKASDLVDPAGRKHGFGAVVDPGAVVPNEYKVFTVLTTDGRLVHGVMPEENERVIVLQTPTERLVLDRTEIDELKASSVSMMPEGLLEALTAAQRRDLVGYLSTPSAPGE